MAVVLKIRRGTTNQWTASNKILQVGELGIDTTLNKLKAGNGSSLWNNLAFLESALSDEAIQDIVGAMVSNNTETDIVVDYVDDTGKLNFSIGANVVTTTSLANTLTNVVTGYVAIADVGQADGVASLDATGKVPDSEIPSTIARDSEIPSLAGYATENYVNSAIQNAGGYTDELAQDAIGNAVGTGLSYNDTTGAISVNTTAIQAKVANVDDTEIGYLNGVTSAIQTQLNDRLTSATASITYAPLASPTFTGTVTIPSGASISGFAPLASPTFTGTIGGITKSMVGLANVDNTTDANKPVSTATQTALDLKLSSSDPAVDYYITNSDSGAYLVNGVSNGLITFEKGKKYRIVINASGHPFWIQTVSGAYSSGNVYSTGITNGGAQVGSILVELPQNAPDNLYYVCQFHSSMQGPVSVQSDNTITTNAQASNYTISAIDSNRLIEMSGGGTLTITDSSLFPVGFSVDVLQTGASQVTIAGTSFTPNATPGLKLRTQWSSATLIKRALNSWVVLGDLAL